MDEKQLTNLTTETQQTRATVTRLGSLSFEDEDDLELIDFLTLLDEREYR